MDLMLHVVRVQEGADDDLAGRVGPPAEDKAPAESQESQVMMTTRATPVCPAMKELKRELATGGHRVRPDSA